MVAVITVISLFTLITVITVITVITMMSSCCVSRFEILGQLCAAPDVLGQVLDEVQARRQFKQHFTEVVLWGQTAPVGNVLFCRRHIVWLQSFNSYESQRRPDVRHSWSLAANISSCLSSPL